MTKLLIRPPRAGDGAGMARCWIDAGRHYIGVDQTRFQVPEEAGLDQWFEASLARAADDRAVFVAEADGEVVGFCGAHFEPPTTEPWRQLQRDLARGRIFVDALAVREAQRRSGVGSALMRAAEKWGRARGATLLLVDSFADGPTSTPFYEQRMGYRRRSIRFQGPV
jgi:GNAT superfamily N-acetyltransferase